MNFCRKNFAQLRFQILDVRIANLPPPSNGQVYAAWLVFDTGKRQGYPLAPLVPYPASGPYHNTFNIPGLAVPLIRGIKAVDITTASASALSAAWWVAVAAASWTGADAVIEG